MHVAPGRVALSNEDAVVTPENQITHDRVDMAQAGRLGGPQREALLRWLGDEASWPRTGWAPPETLPLRTTLEGPAEFVRYNYRWQPGEAKFTDQGKKGNFPKDDEGADLVVENFVLPPHELEAKRLLRVASDGCLVAQLIERCRPGLLAAVLPAELAPCADARGEEGVAARRANWQLLARSGVWKRLRLSVPTDEEENQLARALPYRAERLLWTLRAKLVPELTPVQKAARQKEQRRRARLEAAARLAGEPLPEPEPEPQQGVASMVPRRANQAKVAERPVLRLDEAVQRQKAVRKLLRSLSAVLATRPSDDDETDKPLWTAGIRHGMDLQPQWHGLRAAPEEGRAGGRRLFGRSVQSGAGLFEVVALGAAQPPRVASLALAKEADDAQKLADAKHRKAEKLERQAEHARAVAKRAQQAVRKGSGRVVCSNGEEELEAAGVAAEVAAGAAMAAQLQSEEAEALRNAAKSQRMSTKAALAMEDAAGQVDAVPFARLCAAIERLGLPLTDRETLAAEVRATTAAPGGGRELFVRRVDWLRALNEDDVAAPLPLMNQAWSDSEESDGRAPEPQAAPEPEAAYDFKPLASFSAWKAEEYAPGFDMYLPKDSTDAAVETPGVVKEEAWGVESPAAVAAAEAKAALKSWDGAVAYVERASAHQAVAAVGNYRTWRSVENSRRQPPPPPAPPVPTAEEVAAGAASHDVGKEADCVRGYSGWASRMGGVFGGPGFAGARAGGGVEVSFNHVASYSSYRASVVPGDAGPRQYGDRMQHLFAE